MSIVEYKVKKIKEQIGKLKKLEALPEGYVEEQIYVLKQSIEEAIINVNDMVAYFELFTLLHK